MQPVESAVGGLGTGRATVVRAYELRSDDKRFGGFSGVALSADGSQLALVSDRGNWATARTIFDGQKRLVGLSQWRMGRLRGPGGSVLGGKRADAEGLSLDGRGGWLVSFEQIHRVLRYPRRMDLEPTLPAAFAVPAELSRVAPPNGGLESIETLSDGRLVVVVEDEMSPARERPAWILGGAQPEPKRYVVADGYVPTGATRLDSGRLVFLERHFDPATREVRSRLRWLSEEELREGYRWRPRLVAELGPPFPVDNFEGIGAIPGAGQDQVLIVSDDNFDRRQRTLLYQLQLSLPRRSGCRCSQRR